MRYSAWLLACLALPGAARAQALVARDDAAATVACRGDPAIVRGNDNRLIFAGPCRGLSVGGSGNTVSIDLEPGSVVRITGDDNRILYAAQDGTPRYLVQGRDDSIQPQAPATAVAVEPEVAAPEVVIPAPLVVAAAPYDVQCAGRDVVVRGDGLNPVLHGGCRSLTVEGRYDTITAELMPGAQVSVGGAADIINYVVVGQGPAPLVRTTLPHLRATQIQHYGAVQLKLPTIAAAD